MALGISTHKRIYEVEIRPAAYFSASISSITTVPVDIKVDSPVYISTDITNTTSSTADLIVKTPRLFDANIDNTSSMTADVIVDTQTGGGGGTGIVKRLDVPPIESYVTEAKSGNVVTRTYDVPAGNNRIVLAFTPHSPSTNNSTPNDQTMFSVKLGGVEYTEISKRTWRYNSEIGYSIGYWLESDISQMSDNVLRYEVDQLSTNWGVAVAPLIVTIEEVDQLDPFVNTYNYVYNSSTQGRKYITTTLPTHTEVFGLVSFMASYTGSMSPDFSTAWNNSTPSMKTVYDRQLNSPTSSNSSWHPRFKSMGEHADENGVYVIEKNDSTWTIQHDCGAGFSYDQSLHNALLRPSSGSSEVVKDFRSRTTCESTTTTKLSSTAYYETGDINSSTTVTGDITLGRNFNSSINNNTTAISLIGRDILANAEMAAISNLTANINRDVTYEVNIDSTTTTTANLSKDIDYTTVINTSGALRATLIVDKTDLFNSVIDSTSDVYANLTSTITFNSTIDAVSDLFTRIPGLIKTDIESQSQVICDLSRDRNLSSEVNSTTDLLSNVERDRSLSSNIDILSDVDFGFTKSKTIAATINSITTVNSTVGFTVNFNTVIENKSNVVGVVGVDIIVDDIMFTIEDGYYIEQIKETEFIIKKEIVSNDVFEIYTS